jgi:hypothetical protein
MILFKTTAVKTSNPTTGKELEIFSTFKNMSYYKNDGLNTWTECRTHELQSKLYNIKERREILHGLAHYVHSEATISYWPNLRYEHDLRHLQ